LRDQGDLADVRYVYGWEGFNDREVIIMESDIKFVIADVDGTLVTRKKVVTPRAIAAVRQLQDAGIGFSIVSGRPPRGMRMIIEALGLTGPVAAFNGGVVVRTDMSVMVQNFVPADIAAKVIKRIKDHGLDCWVYTDQEWLLHDRNAPYVDREQSNVRFAPKVVDEFDLYLERVAKIVGVSSDHPAVAQCEVDVQREFGNQVSAARSQLHYLDVTHPRANKGEVVIALAKKLSIPQTQIATIGDMANDVLMFRQSGISIAMGNASPDVQREAKFVTASNEEEGFANAIEFILGHRRDLAQKAS
jgi:Cof subfamily protein (haloacid dehalogenase superfamily)